MNPQMIQIRNRYENLIEENQKLIQEIRMKGDKIKKSLNLD